MFDDDETSDESDNCSGKSCVFRSEDVDVSYCTSTSRKRSFKSGDKASDVTSSRLGLGHTTIKIDDNGQIQRKLPNISVIIIDVL